MNKHYEVTTMEEAWNLANVLFPTDYLKDERSSECAGYPVYRSTCEGNYYYYICDLNDRLELNMGNKTTNIWIKKEQTFEEKIEAASKRVCAKYGFEVRVA